MREYYLEYSDEVKKLLLSDDCKRLIVNGEDGSKVEFIKKGEENPEPQWIPCSERLPNSQETVVVSVRDETGDTRYDYTSCGWVTTDKEYWIIDDEINNYVIAWMPLPEPWKGGEDDD